MQLLPLFLLSLFSVISSVSAKGISRLPTVQSNLKKLQHHHHHQQQQQQQKAEDASFIVAQGSMSSAEKFNLFQLCMFGMIRYIFICV